MKTKTFDCVEMKRRGAEWVQKQISGLLVQDELDFWKKQTDDLRQQQLEKESRWHETLANTQEKLEQMAKKAEREYREGRTIEKGFDEI